MVVTTNAQQAAFGRNQALIQDAIAKSWSKIPPLWPTQRFVAVNPMMGFESMPFEDAMKWAQVYFQQADLPEKMEAINRESIKWLQAFLDEGQATFQMPLRSMGLIPCAAQLIRFDSRLNANYPLIASWLLPLVNQPDQLVQACLSYLQVPQAQYELMLTLMLMTLPGWSAYVQYLTRWSDKHSRSCPFDVSQSEYLAFRLLLVCLLWPSGQSALFSWHLKAVDEADPRHHLECIQGEEKHTINRMLSDLVLDAKHDDQGKAIAQMVFCIDVRSEPFRRALESEGKVETYGFAGFFGVPVSIHDSLSGCSEASCPVILKPQHEVIDRPSTSEKKALHGYQRLSMLTKVYQSIKYAFMAPFSLVEAMGFLGGPWMFLKTLWPRCSTYLRMKLTNLIAKPTQHDLNIDAIPDEAQAQYALNVLKSIGLLRDFSPLVVFCGHVSTAENNAYKASLECGACGGREGVSNARVLAKMLNRHEVRLRLKASGIDIPNSTVFIAAGHNTTTDKVTLYPQLGLTGCQAKIDTLNHALSVAQAINCARRSESLGHRNPSTDAKSKLLRMASSWSEVRPEWGLAGNAALIVGPRSISKGVDLSGRSFLHSYDWAIDQDGSLLTGILLGPMMVAHWICSQYLFSSLDNVAFGGGSKVTKNITGKMGIMQGNASDLMQGLPLQSVYKTDQEPYHVPVRLTVVVHAPQKRLNAILKAEPSLKQLFANGWLHLLCLDPVANTKSILNRDLTWLSS